MNNHDSLAISQKQKFAGMQRLMYKSILSRWFYMPAGNRYFPLRPRLYPFPRGIKFNGQLVYFILATNNIYEMLATNADVILASFFILPREEKLKKMLHTIRKPVILAVRDAFTTSSELIKLARKIEKLGAAGLHTGANTPVPVLKKICTECSIPVFSDSAPDMDKIRMKIDAGVFAVCIPWKNDSEKIVKSLHKSFPDIPVISFCNRSEKIMTQAVKSEIDAVIYRPCIPFKMEWEDL
jgi:hypothetical protein